MANNNGYEMAPLVPEWVKKRVPDNYADDILNNYYERQALYYANVIVYSDYANIVDHP